MGYYDIISSTPVNKDHYIQFTHGSEPSFTYIYKHLFHTLYRYALRIVRDEFVVNTIIQEAFLKLWIFRQRMTGMEHIARFLKLTVRWECMAYYKRPVEKFYRTLVRTNLTECVSDIEQVEKSEDQTYQGRPLQISNLIRYLPDNRQRVIIDLYSKKGFTFPQIARRLGISVQAVSADLQQSLIHLRSILLQPSKKVTHKTITAAPPPLHNNTKLTNEQTHILNMRSKMKYSFTQIASLLKRPQPYIQKQYVLAHKRQHQNF